MRFLGTVGMFTYVALTLSGCTGHTMQDYVDRKFNHKEELTPQPQEEKFSTPKPQEEKLSTPEPRKEDLSIVKPQEEKLSTTKVQKEKSVSPTENEALNKVSPLNGGRADGLVQKSLDNWVQAVWTPSVDQNESIRKMDENTSRNFTIQEYIDKASVHIKNQPKSNEPSLKEQMDKMPAIGK